MARKDALQRIHKILWNRRVELYRRMGRDIEDLGTPGTGDSADYAFETSSDELTSQLAEVEARELQQIERALARLQQGSYGSCENCAQKITLVRLNALPYTTLCIKCQREMESNGGRFADGSSVDWGRIADGDSMDEREFNLSDIELDMSK